MLSASSFRELLDAPLTELMPAAAARRDARFGRRITFSPKIFAPLTMLCRDRCGYCTFAKPPARLDSPYLTPEQVLELATRGAALGCFEALFTLGEAPEDRYPQAAEWLAARGFTSTVDYLVAVAKRVLDETGLLPHANAGALSEAELLRLRAVSPSQGMMIETLADRLHEPGGAHFGAPDKTAARRLATLDAAGPARVPFTTGILVGIGETRAERIEALVAIANAHLEHGHVQEVIVQNFLPKAGTAMHRAEPCPTDEFLWSIAAADDPARRCAPPGATEPERRPHAVARRRHRRLGRRVAAHDRPREPRAAVARARPAARRHRIGGLRARTAAHRVSRSSCSGPTSGCTPTCAPRCWSRPISKASRATPPGRRAATTSTRRRCSRPRGRRAGGAVGEVLDGVLAGQEVGIDEIVTLLGPADRRSPRSPRSPTSSGATSSATRSPSSATATSTTRTSARSSAGSAFSKGPLSLNLRGDPYLLDMEEMQRRVVEAVECGATEVCLQGGIHPDFDGDYYVDVARAVKAVAPPIHVHGFTALEVTEGARRLEMPLRDYLLRLKDAGLATLPGTAAEILDDEVRAIICPDKVNTEEWLYAHRTAH